MMQLRDFGCCAPAIISRPMNRWRPVRCASGVPVTEFRAAVIVGSGSLSFEMVRALTDDAIEPLAARLSAAHRTVEVNSIAALVARFRNRLAYFQQLSAILATIALVVILFESGTSLDLNVLGKSLGTTGLLAIACFILTTLIVAFVGWGALGLETLPAILLGVTLGGTSSAVVIPMVNALKLSEKPSTVLVLESALTDVLCIVGVFALLQIATQGEVAAGKLIGGVLAALVFAAVIGVLGGIGWLLVLGKVRDFPNTISSTLAYVFIVYGATEGLGFSGAIAALALGITLTNFEKFGLHHIPSLDRNIVPLNEVDITFYREAVFLLKTYFFVYLGISIHFGAPQFALAALAMVLLVYVTRLAMTRFVFRDPEYGLRDTAITSMLAPKGLAAAVLAALPEQPDDLNRFFEHRQPQRVRHDEADEADDPGHREGVRDVGLARGALLAFVHAGRVTVGLGEQGRVGPGVVLLDARDEVADRHGATAPAVRNPATKPASDGVSRAS